MWLYNFWILLAVHIWDCHCHFHRTVFHTSHLCRQTKKSGVWSDSEGICEGINGWTDECKILLSLASNIFISIAFAVGIVFRSCVLVVAIVLSHHSIFIYLNKKKKLHSHMGLNTNYFSLLLCCIKMLLYSLGPHILMHCSSLCGHWPL